MASISYHLGGIRILYLGKIFCKKQRLNKVFLSHAKAERIYHQNTCTIRNVKGSISGRMNKV